MPVPLKKLFRFTGYTILFLIAFVGVYLLAAFCLSRITVSKEENIVPEVAIYIKTNGVHTDIVVPVKNHITDWSRSLPFVHTHLKDTSTIQWLAMGWGDKGFYLQTSTWADLKFSTAFKAAFALSTTAMHTTYYMAMQEDSSCKKIMMSAGQYKRLVTYLQQAFLEDAGGQPIPIITNANYNDADAFYEATGRYSLFKTCNTWANAALKTCGQKACLWTAFDTGIFLKYE